jgi:hypothetical protein
MSWACKECGKHDETKKPVSGVCLDCLCKSLGITGCCDQCGMPLTRRQVLNAKSEKKKNDRNTQGRWCSRKCMGEGTRKENHARWSGGKTVNTSGYVSVLVGGKKRYVLEHRLVMELHIGRKLFSSETVHHKNGNRADNRIENLELWDGNHGNGQRKSDLILEKFHAVASANPHCISIIGFIGDHIDQEMTLTAIGGTAVTVPL